MFDSHPFPDSVPGRIAVALAAASAGVLLGITMMWTGNMIPSLAGIVLVIAAGVGAAWLRPPFFLVMATVATALLTSTLAGQLIAPDTVVRLVNGMLYTVCFLMPMLVAAVRRARGNYLRRGWDLAFAEAREHEIGVERAVTREREAMAGEIHDGLGHRLTLIAVQAARLSLDEGMPDRARTELERIRANAAAAADELGETVGLLTDRNSEVTASLGGLGIGDVVDRARSSGVEVRTALAPGVEDTVGDHTRAALLRALQEGLTNAAKHAPGAAVEVAVDLDADEVLLRMRNAAASRPSPVTSGHGIVGLRHRAELLGGSVEVSDGDDFVLTVRLPRDAAPTAADTRSSRTGMVSAEAAGAEHRHRSATRLAWRMPTAMTLLAALVAVGYFVFANLASVLPPDRFAAIEVGDSRTEAELLLPPVEMLDAPSAVLPEPSGTECAYYEASVSFFERVDVYRICFADGRVHSTTTMPSR